MPNPNGINSKYFKDQNLMGLDSLELVMLIEQYFDIQIRDQDAEKLVTVNDMVIHVSKLLDINNHNKDILGEYLIKLSHYFSNPDIDTFSQDLIINYLDFQDFNAQKSFEEKTKLSIPDFDSKPRKNNFFEKLKSSFSDYFAIDWKGYSVTQFVETLLAHNIFHLIDPKKMKSQYEVYLAIVKITVDKMGVDYIEVTQSASFTNDLGIE